MGKNGTIKSVGNIIGNIVLHKIKSKYGNKPEAVPKMLHEVSTYRDNAFETALRYNCNEKDKEKIKHEALKGFNKRIKKYPDIKFPETEPKILIEETINDIL